MTALGWCRRPTSRLLAREIGGWFASSAATSSSADAELLRRRMLNSLAENLVRTDQIRFSAREFNIKGVRGDALGGGTGAASP